MNQTKIYAIIVTAVLILGGPAGYFFTTQDLTLQIQEKDEKIEQALKTLKKAKSSIENKDSLIEEQTGKISSCKKKLIEKDEEIVSIKNDLESAYAGISDDIISTESSSLKKEVAVGTGEDAVSGIGSGEIVDLSADKGLAENSVPEKQECPTCEKCVNNNVFSQSSGGNFDEKIVLESMDLAYNKGLGEKGLPYIKGSSETLLEMYNGGDETLKAKIGYYCSDEFLSTDFYGKKEKSIVRSYERAFCKDEKYENCSSEIKSKIDILKSEENILGSNVVRVLTKYNEDVSNINQEMFAVYDDFGDRVCSWVVNTSDAGAKSYVQIR